MTSSAIYRGWVWHHRLGPREHNFRYRVWWLLLDLDELETTASTLWLLSLNRPNLFSFYNKDYGDNQGTLPQQIVRRVSEAGIDVQVKRICLFVMPRILGYAFNPLCVYFCYGKDDTVCAAVYEVHNTFGERHSYIVQTEFDADGISRHQAPKNFYVSPFMNMDLTYDFRVRVPADEISIAITASDEKGPVIHTSLYGQLQCLSDLQLLRAFITHPFLTLKIIAAIHWEALRLWIKGYRTVSRNKESSHRTTAAVQGIRLEDIPHD